MTLIVPILNLHYQSNSKCSVLKQERTKTPGEEVQAKAEFNTGKGKLLPSLIAFFSLVFSSGTQGNLEFCFFCWFNETKLFVFKVVKSISVHCSKSNRVVNFSSRFSPIFKAFQLRREKSDYVRFFFLIPKLYTILLRIFYFASEQKELKAKKLKTLSIIERNGRLILKRLELVPRLCLVLRVGCSSQEQESREGEVLLL